MSATNKHDKFRIDVENALAYLVSAESHYRAAMLKLSQIAKTQVEGDILQEVQQARIETNNAREMISQLHENYSPNGR